MFNITQVNKLSDIQQIESIAKIVFHEIYDAYTPVEFVEEFITKNQSVEAIQSQIENDNYQYFLLKISGTVSGYLGIQTKENTLVLSKLYILKEYRGQNIGQKTLEFINQYAVNNEIEAIELEVSKENEKAIRFYKDDGFQYIKTITSYHYDGREVKDFFMRKNVVIKSI